MVDMKDKFVFVYKNDEGEIINAGILVGCSFSEAENKAKELEKSQGGHYIFSKDPLLAEVVYHFNNKQERHYMAEVEEWEDIQNTIENVEDNVREALRLVTNYIEDLEKKSLDN